MSITDELRKYVKDHTNWDVALTTYPPQRTMTYHEGAMDAIADRIDAEHAEAQRRWMAELDAAREQSFNAGFDDGFASADDWLAQHEDAMREHGWVKLPKDADGEHIRIGDVMEWTDGNGPHVREVTYLQLTSSGWYVGVKNRGLFGALELLRHHKQTTVEDVLREMLCAWEDTLTDEGVDGIIAEYAAKLQLKE